MSGYKLLLSPQRSAYAVAPAVGETLRTQLEGGMGRYRRGLLNPSRTVTVTWKAEGAEYDYLAAFYATVVAEGSRFFRIDLVIDTIEPVEHEAAFIPDSWSISGIRGNTITVTAQLEARPKIRDYDADSLLLALVEEYGLVDWMVNAELFIEIGEDLWPLQNPTA